MNVNDILFKRWSRKPQKPLEQKESQANRAILVTGQKQPAWTEVDYAKLMKAAYEACQTVYSCANEVASSAACVPWLLFRRKEDGDEEITRHPLLNLMNRPNEFEGGTKWREKLLLYLCLAGNVYVERSRNSGPPKELYILRPDRVQVVKGIPAEPIAGYTYSVGGAQPVTYKKEEILHLKLFHPTDDWYGLSPIQVAAKPVDISNWSQEWNAKLLVNDARPSGGLKIEKTLSDDQYKRLRAQVNKEMNETGANWLLLEGGADWVEMAMSPKDMDWIKADQVNTRKICAVFKVAPELIGDSENKTYSNYQEARKALYMEAIIPLLEWLKDELNNWLTKLYGEDLYLDYDTDGIDALQEEKNALYTRVDQAWWLSLNEKREATGFESIEVPEGQKIYIPMALVPIDTDPEVAAEAEEEEEPEEEAAGGANGQGDGSEPEGGNGKPAEEPGEPVSAAEAGVQDPPKGLTAGGPTGKKSQSAARPKKKKGRRVFWEDPKRKPLKVQDFEERVKVRERSLAPIAKEYIKGLNARVLEQIRSYPSVNAAMGFSLNVKEEAKKYHSQTFNWYMDAYMGGINAGLRATKGELMELGRKAGEPETHRPNVHVTPANEERLKKMVIYSGTKIADTEMAEVLQALAMAEEEMWTVEDLTQHLADKMGQEEIWKSRRIARTETAKVENWGELEGYRENEYIQGKGWICSKVEHSREAHIKADDDYSDSPIPLDDAFSVDSEPLMYPGDPSGSPGNIINCLCAIYPSVMD